MQNLTRLAMVCPDVATLPPVVLRCSMYKSYRVDSIRSPTCAPLTGLLLIPVGSS